MRACDLYCSDWFIKARAYVEAQRGEWFILSAKYGLVLPDQVIEPYNLTLNEMTAEGRRAWSREVAAKLQPKCHRGDLVVILAGKLYREHLIPALTEWGCHVDVPLSGMGIGIQKEWLKTRLRRSAMDQHTSGTTCWEP